jgi:hypothetical protein
MDDEDDEDEDVEMEPIPSIGPRKHEVVIRDAAYRTWKALVYYLYTDIITFAPLASSFIPSSTAAIDTPRSSSHRSNSHLAGVAAMDGPVRGRREWIKTWIKENGGAEGHLAQPAPCSAKAIYRLADVSDQRRVQGGGFPPDLVTAPGRTEIRPSSTSSARVPAHRLPADGAEHPLRSVLAVQRDL